MAENTTPSENPEDASVLNDPGLVMGTVFTEVAMPDGHKQTVPLLMTGYSPLYQECSVAEILDQRYISFPAQFLDPLIEALQFLKPFVEGKKTVADIKNAPDLLSVLKGDIDMDKLEQLKLTQVAKTEESNSSQEPTSSSQEPTSSSQEPTSSSQEPTVESILRDLLPFADDLGLPE